MVLRGFYFIAQLLLLISLLVFAFVIAETKFYFIFLVCTLSEPLFVERYTYVNEIMNAQAVIIMVYNYYSFHK